MKSTGTKRVLSVLSAGALVATMSAIPAFADYGKITIPVEPIKQTYEYTGSTAAISFDLAVTDVASTTDTGLVDLSNLKGDFAVTSTGTAAASTVGIDTVTFEAASGDATTGKITVTLDKAFPANTDASPDVYTVKYDSTNEVAIYTVKGLVEVDNVAEAAKFAPSVKAMAVADAKAAILAAFNADMSGKGLTSATNAVADISITTDAAGSNAVTAPDLTETDDNNKYYAKVSYKAMDGYILGTPGTTTVVVPLTVTAAGTLNISNKTLSMVVRSTDDVDAVEAFITAEAEKIEGVASASVAWKDSKVDGKDVVAGDMSSAGSTKVKNGDQLKADVTVVAAPGYTAGTLTAEYTVNVTNSSSSSDDEDNDTGSSSDTTTDFSKDEMDTSTVSGNTFNHPKPEVLQSRLNDNKGTSISIGEVKSGTATVASFAVTLPKNSKNVSQNTVNKVINVLNTISTKSASKNAQGAVDEMLKSADTKNTASMPVSFSRSMDDFGMTVSVTIPVTSKFTNGGTSLYYYNSSTKKLEAQKTTVAIRGGKATFDLTHASEYFLIQGVKDLSAGEGANDSEDTLSSTEATTVATSEAPVVTAPEVTEPAPVDTTVPSVATNPGTGNAPIALAVIPVAVAAAAIIAKKAK